LQPGTSSATRSAIDKALEMHPDRVTVGSVMTTDVYTAKPLDTLSYADGVDASRTCGSSSDP
jgi:phage baseplate assembly protein W